MECYEPPVWSGNVIDEVASFANSFNTSGELSDFSHKLSC